MEKRGDGLIWGKYCHSSTLFSLGFLCLFLFWFFSLMISPLNVWNCLSIGRGHAQGRIHTPFPTKEALTLVKGQPSDTGRDIDGQSDGPSSLKLGCPNPTSRLVPQTMELAQRELHRSWGPPTDVSMQRTSSTSLFLQPRWVWLCGCTSLAIVAGATRGSGLSGAGLLHSCSFLLVYYSAAFAVPQVRFSD